MMIINELDPNAERTTYPGKMFEIFPVAETRYHDWQFANTDLESSD